MIRGIAIVGGNGSGKTTLGKALAGHLGWKAMDVEDYYFKPSSIPYAAPRTKEEVMQLLLADMKAHKQFVFSSVNCDYGPEINSLYDCVIYLQVSKEIRLARVKQRAVDMFGNRVLDGGDMYAQEQQFFQFVACHSPYSLSRAICPSNIETEQNDVAVLHDVLLALRTDEALFTGSGGRAAFEEQFIVDDFRADEAAFDVGMDLSGSLRSLRPLFDGPGPHFRLAGRQEGHEAEEVVGALDEEVETALLDAEVREEFALLLF